MASERNPEQVTRKKDESLGQDPIDSNILGPEKEVDSSGDISTVYFEFDEVSDDSDSNFADIFSSAGNLRSEMNVESFSEILSILSATPHKDREGYINSAGVLYAVDETPDQGIIIGLNRQTYRNAVKELEEHGLLSFDSNEEPELTLSGRKVMDSMRPFGNEVDGYMEASKAFSNIAGKKNNPSDRLNTFLYSIETDNTFSEITEELEVGRRTAVMRYDNMREEGLFTGEPDERRVTGKGIRTYQSVVAMSHRLDEVSDVEYFPENSKF